MLLLLIVLIVLFGGGVGYYGHTNWGPSYGYGGGFALIVFLLFLLFFFERGRL